MALVCYARTNPLPPKLSCLSSLSHTHWHCPSCSHHQPNNPHLNCFLRSTFQTPSPGVPSKVITGINMWVTRTVLTLLSLLSEPRGLARLTHAVGGNIFVTIPHHHFRPITADYDPIRNRGVLVGDTWDDRMDCRHWGAHFSVIRSHKEQRSPCAPESGLRYDGVYRIEKCWRINGIQGYQVCRYLFVRCDNEPAPWTSDEHGDRPRPRPLPEIAELNGAADDITGRKGNPSWDYDKEKGCWLWKKHSPKSKKSVHIKSEDETTVRVKQKVENVSVKKSLSNEFCCQICLKVMSSPLTTPCAHNFCKTCLEGAFAGQSFIRNKACLDGRTLQAQKNIMKCPSCSNDIADFLQNPQVNREMMGTIESLQHQKAEQDEHSEKSSDKNDKNLHDAAEVQILVILVRRSWRKLRTLI